MQARQRSCAALTRKLRSSPLAKDNEYGHPHRETLERLKAAGPLVLRTDRDGTILVVSDGATYSVATEKDTGNIWSRSGTTSGDSRLPTASPSPR